MSPVGLHPFARERPEPLCHVDLAPFQAADLPATLAGHEGEPHRSTERAHVGRGFPDRANFEGFQNTISGLLLAEAFQARERRFVDPPVFLAPAPELVQVRLDAPRRRRVPLCYSY